MPEKIPSFHLAYRLLVRSAPLLFFVFIHECTLATYPSYFSCFYPGTILLKNGDSLVGQILLEPHKYKGGRYWDFGDSIVVKRLDSVTGWVSEFGVSRGSIRIIRVRYHIRYLDGVACSENYSKQGTQPKRTPDSIVEKTTEFVNIMYRGHEALFRLLSAGKVKVYDCFQNPEERITEWLATEYFTTPVYTSLFKRIRLLVVKDGSPEEIPGRGEFNFNFERSRFLVRFINKRYGTSFHVRRFPTNTQMIDYIAANG